jgi:2-methylisocitrate lyase-like PEP mutase family enzyme
MKAMTPAQKLREVLVGPALEVMPGCFDALSAKLVADAGFKVTFMSGFAVSAARLGLPDTGLISLAEMLDSLRNCASGAARILLIGDGDLDMATHSTCSARSSSMRVPAPPL